MLSRITPVSAIFFTKISVALTCAWPPSPEATKLRIILFKACWYVCCVSTILLLLPLLSSIYEYRDNPEILAKSICLSCAVLHATVKMTVCRIRYLRLQPRQSFQMLYHEMETFCKQADDETNVMLQRYVESYMRVYGGYSVWCYLATINVICGPLFLPEKFPTPAKYPFDVEQQPLKSIIYMHQSLVGLQVSSSMCIDINIAVLLFYSAARLELLASKLSRITSERELDACIKLHSEILRYMTEVANTAWPMIFITISSTTIAVAFGSLNIIIDQPEIVKIQYAIVVFSAGVMLLMCAIPADNLMHMSNKICHAAYNSGWYKGSVSMRKKIYQIIFRSQTPVVIRINGILPSLSLRYYAGFLYTSFSYFTAVRMMVNENVIN